MFGYNKLKLLGNLSRKEIIFQCIRQETTVSHEVVSHEQIKHPRYKKQVVNRVMADLVNMNELTIDKELVTLKKKITDLSDDQVKDFKEFLLKKFVLAQHVEKVLRRKEEDYEERYEELSDAKEELIRKHEDAKEELIRKYEDALKDKNLFEKVKFCNLYRLQIDRFEIIFSKEQTFEVLTTFRQCLLLLIPVYEKERKSEKRKGIDSNKKHGAIFREEFTRVEKWQLIILWMYLVEYAQTKEAAGTMFESELETIRSFAVEEKDKIILDYNESLKLPSLRAVYVLREIFITTMKINFSSKSCEAMIDEIKSIARSFNDAYQVCSKEIKKIQNLTATPEEYIQIRVQVNPSEVENDVLVAQCLDMMVNIGIHLATSTVKSIID